MIVGLNFWTLSNSASGGVEEILKTRLGRRMWFV